MNVIHEEADFEGDTGADGKPVELLQCWRDDLLDQDLLLGERRCVELRIRVAVSMKEDRIGQSCSSRGER